MKWTVDTPKLGDIVRVKVKFYYHYGIFENEDSVYQFGYPDNTGIPADEIKVICSDVLTFLNGGDIETAKLSREEEKKRRNPEDTINYAKSRLGRTGYHILYNNCEHFVNECVFGESKSYLLEEARQNVKNKLKK
jgi:hypothetical protein